MTKGKDEFAGGEELPEDFQPSQLDVIVGWARQNYHHEGNQMLRSVVRENVPRYMSARTKHDKGLIIVEILERIRAKSPSGYGLIRQNPKTKRWFYIGTDKAKDKIGHALRKASRDFQRGVKGSPIKQQRKNAKKEEQQPRQIFPPRTPSSSSHAMKAFKNGPPTSIAPKSGLESWPLRSVTSLSSSESQSEELLQHHQHNHHPHPHGGSANQVTVPSSPVTRPGSAASNYPATEVVRYTREIFDEKHQHDHAAWPATPQGHHHPHHYDGHYYHQHQRGHPHGYGHEEYRSYHGHSHHYDGHHRPAAATPDRSRSHHEYAPPHGYGHHERREYQEIAPTAALSGNNFHRIFDEVEVPPQHSYEQHHHQQVHPPAVTGSSYHPEQYPRSVSHEGPLIN